MGTLNAACGQTSIGVSIGALVILRTSRVEHKFESASENLTGDSKVLHQIFSDRSAFFAILDLVREDIMA